MARISTDILISGGGVAGLTAAAAFGSAGFGVICVDPAPPVTSAEAEGADLRTTAFLQPSIPVLQQAGLWDRLAPHAAPLHVAGHAMQVVDTIGAGDTFTGNLAAQLAQQTPWPQALRWANAAAALSTQAHGAVTAMPSRSQVQAFLPS